MLIFYLLLLIIGSCFSPVSTACYDISHDITISYPESSGFLPGWPNNLKTLGTRLMTERSLWGRETSEKSMMINEDLSCSFLHISNFFEPHYWLCIYWGSRAGILFRIWIQVPLTNRAVHWLKWHNILFLCLPLQVILKQGDKIYLQLQK